MQTGDKLHFIGIGGIGMSGLAQMCANSGFSVSGSDRGSDLPENRRIFDMLELQNIRVFPQDGSFIHEVRPDYIIFSSAIEEDNPDFKAAAGIPRLHRSQALAEAIRLADVTHSVAVTGSCGKSTVTAYLAEALVNLGEDPACLNGALVNRFRYGRFAGNYRTGSGKYFVFEADESDKSLVNYTPDYALILNIGTDHYDKAELARVFAQFLNGVRRGAVLEREVYDAVKPLLTTEIPVVVFESAIGSKKGDYAVEYYRQATVTDSVYVDGRRSKLAKSGDRALEDQIGGANLLSIYGMRYEQNRIESKVNEAAFRGGGVVWVPQSGKHAAVNALSVFAMLEMLGFNREDALEALERFGGVWRRFDYAGVTASGAKVFDDYAHNPEKIAAAVEAAQGLTDGQVYAVFQPHGYGPLGFMRDELFQVLYRTLKRDDVFIMMEPYYAGGSTSFKPTSAEVIDGYRAAGRKKNFLTMPDRETLSDFLLLKSKPGDVILVMGARDNSLSDYAKSLTK